MPGRPFLVLATTIMVAALAACTPSPPPKGTAMLVVVDSSGAGQADCSITRTPVGETPWPMTEEAGSSGADGTFAWPMYPGGFIVSALCPDGRRGSTEVQIVSGEESRGRIVVA